MAELVEVVATHLVVVIVAIALAVAAEAVVTGIAEDAIAGKIVAIVAEAHAGVVLGPVHDHRRRSDRRVTRDRDQGVGAGAIRQHDRE